MLKRVCALLIAISPLITFADCLTEAERAFARTFEGYPLAHFQDELVSKIAAEQIAHLYRLNEEHVLHSKIDEMLLKQAATDLTKAGLLYETRHNLDLRRYNHTSELADEMEAAVKTLLNHGGLEWTHARIAKGTAFRDGTYHARVTVWTWRADYRSLLYIFNEVVDTDNLQTVFDISNDGLSVCTTGKDDLQFCTRLAWPSLTKSLHLMQGLREPTPP